MTPDLAALRQQINHALDHHLPTTSKIAQPVTDAMRHAVLGGGKRVRPMLVCGAADAFGMSIQAALPIACAVEFIHAYSLIHDDLPAMDDDDIRHGLPSAHIKFIVCYPREIREHAKQFSEENFKTKIKQFIEEEYNVFRNK